MTLILPHRGPIRRLCGSKVFDASGNTWDYSVMPPHTGLPDEVYMAIIGERRPVLFIEGDDTHSIDSKLYPLIFPTHTVKAVG